MSLLILKEVDSHQLRSFRLQLIIDQSSQFNDYIMTNKENSSLLANKVHPKQVQSLRQPGQKANNVSQFKQSFLQLNCKRNQTQNNYEKVIAALENVIQELFQKIDVYTQDRLILLKENNELKKKVQSLTNIIEVKQRLGQSVVVENSQIFQIMVENNSATRMITRTQESYEFGRSVSNVLQENQQIVDKQQFIIMSHPLSQNISQIEEGEISMSNIGRTQTINPNNIQTPGLHRQNIFIQCPAQKTEGVIRAFYLSAMQKQSTIRHLMKVIQSLRNDITTVIYEAYPTNEFWTDMLCNFLKIVHQQHFDNQMEVLQYIKAHKLIDTLMIKCLKTRIQFLFYNMDSFQMPSITEVFGALTNQFGLRMEINEGQFIFFTKQIKDQNLLLSDRASLQISLNNKSENKFYIKEEEPCFIIYERNETLQFSFYISVEAMLGISQYQLNQGPENQQSFKYSEEIGYSLNLRQNEIEMSRGEDDLEGVVCILNERDMNIVREEEKQLNRKFGHARQRYVQNKSPQLKEPISSSRYFLNRVGSKNSCFDENA